MDLFRHSDDRTASMLFRCAAFAAVLAAVGCASPGPPRAPSLRLPQPVRDLTVIRTGNTVELHFTAPSSSTDKLPLRGGTITGQFCRQLDHQPCVPVSSSKIAVATTGPNDTHNIVTWTDTLPTDLIQGSPRLLGYRVEFFSAAGRSAGASTPAFTAAETPPVPVENLHADGSRLGVILQWNPSAQPGDVLIEREDLAPTHPKGHKLSQPSKQSKSTTAPTSKPSKSASAAAPSIVWLGIHTLAASASQPSSTLDTTALPDTPYRYTAQRRMTVQLGNNPIELRSAPSPPITFTLREIYPPLAPTGLTAVGFFANAPSASAPSFVADLIWQPVDDTGLLAGLAGYNVYRESLNTAGEPATTPARLNITPIPVPSFHDTTADPATRYRYSVTAIDAKGNESPAVTVLLEPSTAP